MSVLLLGMVLPVLLYHHHQNEFQVQVRFITHKHLADVEQRYLTTESCARAFADLPTYLPTIDISSKTGTCDRNTVILL